MSRHIPYSEFERFPETPVELVPYSPSLQRVAEAATTALAALLGEWGVEPYFFGSAALEALGKNEVELALFVPGERRAAVKNALVVTYGQPVSTSNGRDRFEYHVDGTEVEIILSDESDRALTVAKTEYLRTNPDELRRYEEMKRRSAHSKREYLFQKNEFFAGITEKLQADQKSQLWPKD